MKFGAKEYGILEAQFIMCTKRWIMKQWKKTVPAIIILLLIVCAVGCDLLGIGNRFVGTWRWEMDVYWEEITFKQDYTFTGSGYSSLGPYLFTGDYNYTSTTLTLDYDGGSEFSMAYEMSGNSLELTSLGSTWIYIKQ